MKKKEKRTPPGERTAANRRESVLSAETKPETEELGSGTDCFWPREPTLLDRPQVRTEAGTSIGRPASPITNQGGPLKVRKQDGMIHIDGDESSYIRTFGTSDARPLFETLPASRCHVASSVAR